ncbi:hypothetical protein LZ31DRAFT_548015 [Colletotrichum somersetense]|nr:hypothetical protein LZ31DRAFT_548015 [Colletotrichum somersetense]
MEAAIGVIGLSLQLIDSAVKLKRVIDNYQSASTEVHRLAIKIERVEAICGAIKESLEGGPSTRRCSDLIETWGVCVLKSVQSTLAELHDIIAKLEKKAAKKRIVNAAGMAFLMEKDDISRLSKCLDEDLNYLQHMMMAELFSQCNIVQRLVVDRSSAQAASSTEDPATSLTCSEPYTSASAEPTAKRTVTRSNRKTISAYGFHGQAQSVRIVRQSRWQNNRETTTSKDTKTYTFGISGISYRVEFHWQLSMASPMVYSMNIRHVIWRNTDPGLLEDVTNAMCDGDVQALQCMLSAGRLTLSSLCGSKTLFEMAAFSNQPEICRFLVQQNARLCLDEQLCRPYVGSIYAWLDLGPFEVCRRVFEIHEIAQLTRASLASRFRLLAFRLKDIRSLIELYHRCKKPDLDPIEKEDFLNTAWDAAVYLLTFSDYDTGNHFSIPDDHSMGLLTGLVVELINEGVDVHRRVSRSSHSDAKDGSLTALCEILISCKCHRNIEVVLSRWLRILKTSRIDMHGYIRYETAFCRPLWNTTNKGCRGQSLSTKKIEGFEVPFWRRFVDPLGKAYEVRHEFRNWGRLDPRQGFSSHGVRANLRKLAMEDHRQHVAMKGRELVLAIQNDWPFEYSFAETFDQNLIRVYGFSVKEESNIERSCLYARELMQNRFDRRQMRKLYKSGYLKREKHILKLPGAWPILEW